jgi:DNA/RNA-binding domain of Phe-tRNA-synthetase-like protein
VHFAHSPEIWRQFPQLVPGALLAEGIGPGADAEPLLTPWFARARERLASGSESELAEISAWRRVYTQMGLKPTQYRSAAEALLRRFRREGDLPRLHPLVDLCNAVSLAFAIPVAVFDLAGVSGSLDVRHARGDEQHLAFSGEIESPEPGEVIFADAAGHAHARRWTFRQSRRSTVTADTARALIVAEALHPSAAADVPAVVDALAQGLATLWSEPAPRAILTAQQPRFEF